MFRSGSEIGFLAILKSLNKWTILKRGKNIHVFCKENIRFERDLHEKAWWREYWCSKLAQGQRRRIYCSILVLWILFLLVLVVQKHNINPHRIAPQKTEKIPVRRQTLWLLLLTPPAKPAPVKFAAKRPQKNKLPGPDKTWITVSTSTVAHITQVFIFARSAKKNSYHPNAA